jgi:hypothetical protein
MKNGVEGSQMKPSSKLVLALVWALWLAGVALGSTVFIGASAIFQDANRVASHRGSAIPRTLLPKPTLISAQTPESNTAPAATRYLLGFADDRSLNVATAVEQVRTGYVRYAVRLQLSSGAEQLIDVMGPPGGLRPEVRDVTGDGVRNDLVLTPALIRWPLTVLMNDGHDHFEVVVSGNAPRSLGDGGDRASGTRDGPSNVALLSSRIRAEFPTIGEGPSVPELQANLFSPIAQAATVRLGHSVSSGRAPPLA